MEKWKDIKGYEGLYQVSDLGRVRRVDGYVNTAIKHNSQIYRKGRILKTSKARNGYLSVSLCKGNIKKTVTIHRLVGVAFVKNDDVEHKLYLDHKNCKKSDNRAENLEWVTALENSRRAKENGLCVSHRRKPIRCKQLNIIFNGSYECAEYINDKYFHNSKQVKSMAAKIRACCIGLQKSAYNFTWEYVEGSTTRP